MPENIDYSFLSAREGGCKTTGYVPMSSKSSSGVTVATGFDLGARSEADLNRLGLTAGLVAKLKPYLGEEEAGRGQCLDWCTTHHHVGGSATDRQGILRCAPFSTEVRVQRGSQSGQDEEGV